MTRFLRLIESEDKAAALLQVVRGLGPQSRMVYELDPQCFRQQPRAVFAYWVSEGVRRLFGMSDAMASNRRVVCIGDHPGDNFKFVRLWWETAQRTARCWKGYLKGGKWAPYYCDIHLVTDWDPIRSTYRGFVGRPGRGAIQPSNVEHFMRPGLTWPLRTTSEMSVRVFPSDCVFSNKGPAVLADRNDPAELLGLLAVSNCSAFRALIALQLAAVDAAARSYEVGIIQATPVPSMPPSTADRLVTVAHRSWALKRSLDTCIETSHAFTLPALLQVAGDSFLVRTVAWSVRLAEVESELARNQAEIDDCCFNLYGMSEEDRRSITEGFGASAGSDAAVESAESDVDDDGDEESQDDATADVLAVTAELVSWTVGVAMGRFDVRLATGHGEARPEPDPFDPLPVCSPGMLTGGDGLPMARPPADYSVALSKDGVLVDDADHPRDMTAAVRSVFETVFSSEGDARWREAGEILDPSGHDLRTWLAHSFFEHHIKRYSKSRRKAPIYWQLGVPSGRYSVWMYAHLVSNDRLFQVLKDILQPKLNQEEGVLGRLKQEAGASPTQSQRKAVELQEDLIAELKTLIDDVARVAPMWAPDLDDGVVICLAPLWRLFPQNKAWQKECKRVWDKLVDGDYDWAHMAMHLWPERVVPKCQTDRSLAIAHGLEEVFWEQDEKDKWVKRKPPEATSKAGWQPTIERLVAERTSRQVKDALANLLAAPTAEGGGKRGRRSQAATESAANGEAACADTKRNGKTAKARDESEELF